MGKDLSEQMMKMAEGTPKSPVVVWWEKLSVTQQKLLQEARKSGKKYGAGYDLLLIEEKLRLQVIREKDARRQ